MPLALPRTVFFTILSRLQYINPENYTRLAYIGKDSMRKRVKLLDKELEETAKKRGLR